MCGRLNVTDDAFVQGLCVTLGIDLTMTPLAPNRFVRAASDVQIIREFDGQRVLQKATWWLLLEPSDTGFKPSKYTSFNTRYDKLDVPRAAGYQPFRTARCIIIAKGFGETEFEQQGHKKAHKHYHDLIAIDDAIAFAGLYKKYINTQTGEVTLGCSIITLPPHPKLAHIHSKSSPLMLPQDDTLDAWLDPNYQQVNNFNHLLHPRIRQDLIATEINKPSLHQPIGPPSVIQRDIM
jgi:putative SOS response-associated peptidase YedK